MAAPARQMTGSIQKGRAASWHNRREGYLRDGKLPEHIDPERVADDPNMAVYRHVDAALFGGYLPFTKHQKMVSSEAMHFESIAFA